MITNSAKETRQQKQRDSGMDGGWGDGRWREEGRVDKIRKMGVSNTGMVSKIGG